MNRNKTLPFDDPVFGVVTLDQWEQDFWTLRKFSAFCPFPDVDENDFSGAEPHHKPLIEDWANSISQLSQICRISNVHDALRNRRIFELSIGRKEGHGITEEQRDAFRAFVEAESQITDAVLNTVVEYYHSLDEAERNDPLEILSNDDLVHFIDGINRSNIERICAFDGIGISCPGATTPPSLCFGFEAYWDFEHGFGVVWRDGKIIGCGPSEAVSDMMGWEY